MTAAMAAVLVLCGMTAAMAAAGLGAGVSFVLLVAVGLGAVATSWSNGDD